MAIGWLTVLKLVPWGDVIENAPKVAQGAKKLWKSVGPRPAVEPAPPTATAVGANLQDLQAQVLQLQQATAELHQQMRDSSELIQSLADQNTQLIGRVETLRKRLLWLVLVVLGLVLALLIQRYF
ncbi:MAG: hypothetical protein IPN53_10395 [Comamonadaceae bacterium]|nr:hypothetical protein [Comamonadaceae bacterium]